MMQETGNNPIFCGKKLSIQLLLDGLCFYSNEKNQYTLRHTKNKTEINEIIKQGISVDEFDEINLYHNSLDYIIVPDILFDENMCEAYLQSKGITLCENQSIKYTTIEQYTYISIIDNGIFDILSGKSKIVRVLPVIASVISYSENLGCDNIALIVKDNFIHIAYNENKLMMFCETLPIVSDTDIDFFIGKIISENSPRKNLKVVSLFEIGEGQLSKDIITKYNIERLTKDKFFVL